MTEQETKDLAELLKKKTEIEKRCMAYLRQMTRWDARQLETSGYKGKTVAEAMKGAFEQYEKRIVKLVNEYVKKYPDDGMKRR